VAESFRIEVERTRGSYIAALVGELDVATTADVDRHFAAVTPEPSQRVVLDLRRLRFISAAGVHAIEAIDRRLHERGFRLEIVAGPEPVQRVFELCGMIHAFRWLDPWDID
jgi:anti-sigma B factor antagonist